MSILSLSESHCREVLHSGTLVGPFAIERLIRDSHVGEVYRARHRATGSLVALTVLPQSGMVPRFAVQRARRDAERIANAAHPDLATVVNWSETLGGRPCIATEWLDGFTIDKALQDRGRFSPAQALALMSDIGGALTAAHNLGVVHGCLDTHAVTLLPHRDWFAIKLGGFGVSSISPYLYLHQSLSAESATALVKTMAPEQILGEEIDARTDIYGLALLFYQLVCGQLPFASLDRAELERMHLHTPPPCPSHLAPVSKEVDTVIQRALGKRKADRYAAVAELVAELRRAILTTTPKSVSVPGANLEHRGLEMGIGMYIEVDNTTTEQYTHSRGRTRRSTPSNEVLDRAREFMVAAGLSVHARSSHTILGVASLARVDDPERYREDIVRGALARQRRWTKKGSEHGPVQIRITIHVADIEVETRGNRVAPTGGTLLRLATWPRAGSVSGVLATAKALTGIAKQLRITLTTNTELYAVKPFSRHRVRSYSGRHSTGDWARDAGPCA